VALIYPGKSQRFAIHEPLNLGFMASYLEKHGIEVAIIDELAGQDVQDELSKFKPDIAGITATTTLVPEAYKIADHCKKSGYLTVMGGVHVSIFPEEGLKHADIVVKGEGETALMEIINKNIKSGIVTAPYIKEIDDIPPPARHLIQMDFYLKSKDRVPYIIYFAFVPPNTKIASLLTSRGCPYNCIYCHNTWRGTPVRFNSAERTIWELEHLKDKYGIGAAFFVEDNFFIKKSRARRVCELMIEKRLNLIWGAGTRADNIDLDMLKLAKEAGCRLITFGLESGSQRILDVLKKGLKVEDSRSAVRMCNEVGIMANASFMIGNPTETMEDLELTRKFVRENRVTMPAFYITTPYPGTELWDLAAQRNLLPKEIDWATFAQERVVANFSEVPKEKIEEIRASWYLEYFFRYKREALRLIWMSLRYPRASTEKIFKTLIPLFKKIFRIRKR